MIKRLEDLYLRRKCDPSIFDFTTTDELEPLNRIIGQERAIEALKLGLGVKDVKNRYNIYVSGEAGTGKISAVEHFLSQISKGEPTPPDLCYVHNFDDPRTAHYIELPPGLGSKLRADMNQLISRLKRDIPKVFESDEFRARSKKISERFVEHKTKLFEKLEQDTKKHGFAIQRTPIGVNTIPLKEGKEPLSQEEYETLSPEEKQRIIDRQAEVQELIKGAMQEITAVEEAREEEVRKLAKEAVLFMIEPRFTKLTEKYGHIEKVVTFLADVQNDIIANLEDFQQGTNQAPKMPLPMPMPMPQVDRFKRYDVNLLVDNSTTEGAPVIVEENATYPNLFGSLERRIQFGFVTTDFTMIRAGSLHRANGGYLVLTASNLFRFGISWEALKIAIKRREIKIEDPAQMLGYAAPEGVKPEPVSLNVKIVIIGSPLLYELIHHYDEDFQKLFTVKSEFDVEMAWVPGCEQDFARFIRTQCEEDPSLCPFDRTGVARIVEYASELAGDQQKLSCRFSTITSIIKEACYWAKEVGALHVAAEHVRRALEKQDQRRNMTEEKIREMIVRGQILVDTDKKVVGQVNGLAVHQWGDFAFGRPSRITANVYTGKDGVVDIEREAKLGGKTHTKGIMILKGFLGEKFAKKKPFSFSASLTFEQSYSQVDGDSASSTELYAILSSLADLRIDQGIAVTGSVNQKGEIQPIGGVNEKIEGFYMVCKAKELTGKQGVLIPKANIDNLMLKDEVVEAVAAKKFHIYPISTIEEGIEVLTGVPAGTMREDGTFTPQTVFARVQQRLEEIGKALKKEKEEKEE